MGSHIAANEGIGASANGGTDVSANGGTDASPRTQVGLGWMVGWSDAWSRQSIAVANDSRVWKKSIAANG